MDKVQKTAFTDYNAPSSEPFRIHFYLMFGTFEFQFLAQKHAILTRFSWFTSVIQGKCWGSTLKHHEFFYPYVFHVVTNSHPSI
jgi:hypothetical protein